MKPFLLLQMLWTLAPAPEPGLDASFGGVVGAATLSNGTVAVADSRSSSVYFIERGGRVVPVHSQFRLMVWVGKCGGDTVAVWDPKLSRLTKIDGRSYRVATEGVPEVTYALTCGADGRRVVTARPEGWGEGTNIGPRRTRSEVRLQPPPAEDPDRRGAVFPIFTGILLGDFPGQDRVRYQNLQDPVRQSEGPMPYGRNILAAVTTDRVYLGTADSNFIQVFDLAGRKVGAVSWPGARRKFERADRERVISDVVESERLRGVVREDPVGYWTKNVTYNKGLPDALPAYDKVLADGSTLWVQEGVGPRDTTRQWRAFDAKGKPVGRLVLPIQLEPYEIQAGYILGRWRNGVDSVRRYRLVQSR